MALWSQIAGLAGLAIVLPVLGESPAMTEALWGIGAGDCYGIAISSLYRGLALGIMAIVAPVSACGVVVPVMASLAFGNIPSVLTALSIVAALGGAILASLQIGWLRLNGSDRTYFRRSTPSLGSGRSSHCWIRA